MAAVVARAPHMVDRASTPPPHLLNTTTRGAPTAVPNKHIPNCPTGPRPDSKGLETPPDSPTALDGSAEGVSLLYPPNEETRISDEPGLYSLTAGQLADALEHLATQPLPDPRHVFPWLHGLHPENQIQQAFFVGRKQWLRRTPKCLRCITIVKVGGDLGVAKLKSAVGPGELLIPSPYPGNSTEFIEPDPKDGFSVRNFQIQTTKMATVSDIVVYGDAKAKPEDVMRLATRLSKAQRNWREKHLGGLNETLNVYNTFVVSGRSLLGNSQRRLVANARADPFSTFEENHPELVSVDSSGRLTGNVMDFCKC
jgi:dual specificity MAP kinase phosphatase